MNTLTSIAFISVVSCYAIAAAVVDIRLHRIPNYLTVPAAVFGLLFHTFFEGRWGILLSLAGLAVGFGLLLLPWLLGGSGMGDVKLLAALGAWLGPTHLLYVFVVSVFLAAVLALGVMVKVAATKGVSSVQRNYLAKGRSGKQRSGPQRILPFAVPVALGTWIVLAWLTMSQGGQVFELTLR
ncbi:MAG: hypothetical protein CMJ81_23680 [Planctomycetaceae bacterium]|nr:hypothetical protein [Planctomycetaceae bacterium]MBP61678.1 hypothetical protein [Planctomycetaceae bacterium]